MSPTILVAADHPLVRAAVLHALHESLPAVRVVETASAAARMHGVFIFFLTFLFYCANDKYCRRDGAIQAVAPRCRPIQ